MDAVTGRQRWALTLADASDRSLSSDVVRRFGGATPAFSQGLLVCPTSLGAIVAVDLTKRSFTWGFQPNAVPNARLPGNLRFDATPIIDGQRALVQTPPCGQMICLDLTSGRLLWERFQPDLAFVACVADGRCLVCCKHRFLAVRMEDGVPAWDESPFVAIPAGGMPSGRGIRSGQYYYLPTTDPELVQIDLHGGRVARRIRLVRALGNLIPGRDYLLSQDSAGLALLGATGRGTAESAAAFSPSAVPEEVLTGSIDELIGLLAHERFSVREAASRALLDRGRESLDALAAACGNHDLEIAYRASAMLLYYVHSPDVDMSFLARQSLLIAHHGETGNSFGRRAYEHERTRQEPRALRRLAELGAQITNGGRSVTLANEWKGGTTASAT